MSPPIVTSIPPVFSRKDTEGHEIGDEYLARCIASWRACGFDPVTVNSEAEDLHPLIADLGVEVVRVPRDARAITGRPHVYLGDLLDAARAVSAERVFIVNADIELETTPQARERLARLGPMEAVGVRRRDHDGEKSPTAAPYEGGIDLLGAGRGVLDGIDAGTLVFGMPWWDHYLPLMVLWRGNTCVAPTGVSAWHLKHEGHWSKRQYTRSGQEFLRLVGSVATPATLSPEMARHLAALGRIRQGRFGGSPVDRVQNRLLAALLPRSPIYLRRVLRDVSGHNVSMLDRLTEGTA